MVTFKQAGDMLDRAAESLPEGIFDRLNGGVNLLPRVEYDEYGFVILGLYHRNAMGRYIEIFYGSFAKLYKNDTPEQFGDRLRRTLFHELTHHVEDLAGDRSLEKADIVQKAAWLAGVDCGGEEDERQPPPPAECVIADAAPYHVPDIAAIEKECFSDPWPEKTVMKNLTDGQSHVCLVALEEGELLGYILILYAADTGDISNVAVAPEQRRRSVGMQLVDAAAGRAKELGLTELGLEVRQSNTEAIALYNKAGFQEVGRRKNYYRRPKEDAILMTKYL